MDDLFPPKFITDDWLSSGPIPWAINNILATVCGLGLFVLFLSCFQPAPSSPPSKKHRTSRKVRNPGPDPAEGGSVFLSITAGTFLSRGTGKTRTGAVGKEQSTSHHPGTRQPGRG